jgi:hypothetical protein
LLHRLHFLLEKFEERTFTRSSTDADCGSTARAEACLANGIELSKRGRIPADVVSQFKAAGN